MSTYAIIKTGGKQVKVEVGQAVYVEKLKMCIRDRVCINLTGNELYDLLVRVGMIDDTSHLFGEIRCYL